MDLLRNAYSTTASNSDDGGGEEEEEEEEPGEIRLPPPKRPKPEYPNPIAIPSPPFRPSHSSISFQREAPIPGRYVSKRERAARDSGPADNTHPNPPPAAPSTVLGCFSDSNLPRDILSRLRKQPKSGCGRRPNLCRISERPPMALCSHTKAVSAIQWSPSHRIQKQIFTEDQAVGVTKFHPSNSSLFLSGGSKGFLRLWDVRTATVVHQYGRRLDPILDIDFTVDGKQFISSSDVSGSLVSENSIIVWDVSRQVPLSNQVYVEAYTCPCIRTHPFDPYFVAQSQGNYIAIFSSKPPFRLDKYRRFEKHGVSGFPIKCNFSLDGQMLASGSSDGFIYLYNSRSSELIKKIRVYEQPCTDVVFHPVISNVIVSCSWNGEITVLEWDDDTTL